MKIIIGAALIFAIISTVCICYDNFLNNTVEQLTEYIEDIHSSVKNGEYVSAERDFSALKKEWESKEKFIQIETEHSELDIINEQLAVLSSHFDHHEYDEFYETLYKLEYFLNHISEKKRLNLKTIL